MVRGEVHSTAFLQPCGPAAAVSLLAAQIPGCAVTCSRQALGLCSMRKASELSKVSLGIQCWPGLSESSEIHLSEAEHTALHWFPPYCPRGAVRPPLLPCNRGKNKIPQTIVKHKPSWSVGDEANEMTLKYYPTPGPGSSLTMPRHTKQSAVTSATC
ncbi:hypothetical protein EWB00_000799 [Schistosoma japonicum]|uniref:Uncharacterized protein n=1 Tax=Schistosoma japonicum TaxID=6182 RepID=A0A4Z2CK35_SCHJA|nr:hypothetical protein EWB00_000799 [Schistosoma japonicum]